MKKYITIAGLVVAGSAFAGAETVNLTLPTTTQCSEEGWHGSTAEAVLSHTINHDYGVYAGNGGGAVTFVTGEGLWTQTSDYSGYIALAGRSGAGGEDFALVLGSEISIGAEIESITLSYNIPASSTMAFDGKTMEFALGYISNNTAVQTETSSVALTNNTAIPGTLTLSFTDTISWSEGDKIIVALKGPATTPNTSLYSVEISSVSYSSIPEPSAFGLLAGLGALALVGARRRRRA